MAFEIVESKGLSKQRRFTREFNTIGIEPDEDPKKYTPRVDRIVRELERLEAPVSENQVNFAIISGLLHNYEMEQRMLDKEIPPTRDSIKHDTF